MPSNPHPLWHLLPDEQQGRRQRFDLHRKRLGAFLRRRRQLIILTIALYLSLCALTILLGLPQLAGVAILPLLLVPPVGYLIYWLVWKEFHH